MLKKIISILVTVFVLSLLTMCIPKKQTVVDKMLTDKNEMWVAEEINAWFYVYDIKQVFDDYEAYAVGKVEVAEMMVDYLPLIMTSFGKNIFIQYISTVTERILYILLSLQNTHLKK